jgi:cold shock CspA family protein
LRSISSDLRASSTAPSPVPAPTPDPSGLKRAKVKFIPHGKNFGYVTLADGRDAFLHRDDFDGEWPPRPNRTVLFSKLIESNHWRCKWRAKDAMLPEALQ